MEVVMLKAGEGLAPLDQDEAEKLRRFKAGAVVRGEFKTVRNGQFFRKWWALARLAFDMASERMTPMTHNGVEVVPNFDRFRQDLTIMAGYYKPVFGADGSVKLEAESLQWSKMDEEKFARLYSATIDAILQKILPDMSQDDLQDAINATLAYA